MLDLLGSERGLPAPAITAEAYDPLVPG